MTKNIYGPQTKEIKSLLKKIKSFTPKQIANLGVVWDSAWNAAWDAAWDAARSATWDAARSATWDATLDATLDVAWDAAMALVVRDLIGDQFTQEHYDILTKPWRTVIGEIHSKDTPLTEGDTTNEQE